MGSSEGLAGTPVKTAATAAAAAPAPRRVRVLLLLHAAWVAALLLLVSGSLGSRRRRHLDLARQLLAAHEAEGTAAPGDGGVAFAHCGEALQLPQVALLFLVKGDLHHEATWRLWFQQAAGLLPLDGLAGSLCGADGAPVPGEQQQQRLEALRACTDAAARMAQQSPLANRIAASNQALHQLQARKSAAHWRQLFGSGSRDGSSAVSAARAPGTDAAAAVDGAAAAVAKAAAALEGAAAAVERGAPEPHTAALGPAASGVLGQQLLFDVYVHPHPNYTGHPEGSLFHGRELPPEERVLTQWGQHSLVDATRALLRAAHRNPRVTKFVLLSESDLPLYSPHLLYAQLVGEQRSRLNACNTTQGWRLFDHRWIDRMATPSLHKGLWRKSWQWFVLNRAHVDLVLADIEVDASLRAHCRTMWEPERRAERECYSDEHYIPTLLAVHGRDNETDCQGWLMDTDWSRVHHLSPHPYEYPPGEVTEGLVRRLRRPHLPGCSHAAQAAVTARGAFMPASALEAATAAEPAGAAEALAGVCDGVRARQAMHAVQHTPLGPQCRLLARKFKAHTVAEGLAALAPCDSSALVLNDGTCPGETQAQAARRRARHQWRSRVAPLLLLGGGALVLVPLLVALALGLSARVPRARGSGR